MYRAARMSFRFVLFLLSVLGVSFIVSATSVLAATDEWSTSLHDISRTGSSTDTSFSVSQAAQLKKLWSFQTGGPIASQPAIVNGVAYVGSWDGYEYAFNLTTGAQVWKTYLGVTNGEGDCNPQSAGVSSAPTVQNGVVYVGGGDTNWYALDASTGNVLWKVYTGDNSVAGGHYNWSSPLLYGGYAYVGIASLGDCPLVQGQLLKVDLSTHQVVNTLNLVPDGQVGGGIWTSPAYDTATNKIFTVTGTEQSDNQQYAQAVLAIDPSTMTVVDSWHLPENQAVADSDWTTSTALFTDANNRQLVLATNKNGNTYAFLRSNLAAGPVWQRQVALGNNCAACGFSTVSSAAIGQGRIYQAGGVPVINGQGYGGSVQAFDPTTGAVIWQHPTPGPIIGAVTYMNGMVIDGEGSALEVLDASNGHRLYSYDTGPGALMYAAPAVGSGVVVTGSTNGSIYAFNLGTLNTPPPDPNCPTGYACQDIGMPLPTGSESATNGTWNITAGGGGVGGASDAFRLMSQMTAGDAQIIARIASQQSISTDSQSGIMIRQSNDPGSPYYAVFATPNGVKIQYRNTFDGDTTVINDSNPGTVPLYLEIQRVNDRLQAATSTDGTTFTLVPGATPTVIMPYASMIGLAASSGTNGAAGTTTAANVAIGVPNNVPRSTLPPSTCPTGWSCGDIGDPLTVGDQSLSGGTWTVKGSGNGIDGSSDQLHYVWQTVTGDSTVTTRLVGQTDTDASAKAGVMMRASTDADAAFYGAFLTPTNGIKIVYRDTKGLPSNVVATTNGAPPQYIQVARSGITLTTYTSNDGSTWTPVIGSTVDAANLSGNILAGLAVTAANANAMSTVTASLLGVANTAPNPPTICLPNWTCADVGSPIPAGSQYLVNGAWSLLAGGKDIWDTHDEFRYVAEAMTGDGSITTHISSQGNTDPWAKAGIMVRASTDTGAPYFGIFVTPGNGTVVQYRSTSGDTTTQVNSIASAAPTYLKVTRSGNTFTAYTSTDGNTWTAYPDGSVTVTLPSTSLAGMASTSHSQFTTNTVNFDSFNVSTGTSSLPSPWTDEDVGSATPAGSAGFANNAFTIKGGGNDIWGTPYDTLDQFHYVSQTLNGDGSIVARVTSQTNTSDWAKAGVMIKQATTSGSSYALLGITPANGITFQYNFNNSVSGGNYTLPNAWLKLTRAGSTITAYTSTDGNIWTQVGNASVAMNNPVTIGLFVTSHNSGALSTATFDNVNVSAGGSTSGLPSPWTDTDIDNATPAGSAGFANNAFTIKGGGNDIWGTPGRNLDQFHYVSQPLSGNATITARVTSQTNTSDWAKAGVMVKQSTTAGSDYALLGVTPANGMTFQYDFTGSVGVGNYTFPNAWVRLKRVGSTITAYTSTDGNIWTHVGSTTITLSDPITAGLFATSHNSGALSTATFDNVSVTTP